MKGKEKVQKLKVMAFPLFSQKKTREEDE